MIFNFRLLWNSTVHKLLRLGDPPGSERPRVRDGGNHQGNFYRCPALICMENFEHREKPPITKEEREAKKERARQDAVKALALRKKEDDAFRANYERLKAERMAREAAEAKA